MNILEAIEHLRADLERYAALPKASARAVAFRTAVLNALIDGHNEMERQLQATQKRIREAEDQCTDAREQLAQMRLWCQVHGMDLGDWDRLPQAWKNEHLHRSVRVAGQLRYADGLEDACGVRMRLAYRNTNAFAYTVISSVAQEEELRACLRRLNREEPPKDLPLLLWDENHTPTTTT